MGFDCVFVAESMAARCQNSAETFHANWALKTASDVLHVILFFFAAVARATNTQGFAEFQPLRWRRTKQLEHLAEEVRLESPYILGPVEVHAGQSFEILLLAVLL